MAKQEAEWSNKLSIFWLKKHGYLDKDFSYKSGGIKWTYGMSGGENSIGFSVKRDNWGMPHQRTYINLRYTHTDRWSEQRECMDYNIEFTTSPCKYGGVRYWFLCPLSKNGQYCGRRVGVIYSIGKWFGCRYCGNIVYASQMRGGKYRGSSVCFPDIDRAKEEIKRYYYNGKPTRKYERYIRLNNKLNQWIVLLAAKTDKRFADIIK